MVDNFVDKDWVWEKFWDIYREIMEVDGPDAETGMNWSIGILRNILSLVPQEENTEFVTLTKSVEKFSCLIRDTNCDLPDNNIAWQDGEIHVFNEKGDALYSAPTLLDLIRKVGESS